MTGDSVYGDDRRLRVWLEEHERAHVLAISGKEHVWLGSQPQQVKTILPTLGPEGWCRFSAGEGTKGPRWYDWTWRQLATPLRPQWDRWLLVRRSLSAPTELRAYVVFAPRATAMETVVPVAGSRWTIEQCFEEAKGEIVLDQYEMRSWTGWYRHITLAMWAYALLAVLRIAHLRGGGTQKNAAPAHSEQLGSLQGGSRAGVPLSVREIRRLFWGLMLATQQRVERILAWSMWRRWHQGVAKYWHYKRRSGS